jgi:hypothetical protein
MSDLSPNISTKVEILRRKRSNEEACQSRLQIVQVLQGDHPQSVRHVYYRMTDPRLPEPVEKTEAGYRQTQYQVSLLRKQGGLPYSWVSDMTRRGYHITTFDGASDFIRPMSGHYRADAWRDAEHYVEVWTESRSMAGVIEPLCKELGVSLYPSGGFTSLTLAYQAAGHINAQLRETGKKAQILYIGDYDQAGALIDRDIEGKLREHLDPAHDLSFHPHRDK